MIAGPKRRPSAFESVRTPCFNAFDIQFQHYLNTLAQRTAAEKSGPNNFRVNERLKCQVCRRKAVKDLMMPGNNNGRRVSN